MCLVAEIYKTSQHLLFYLFLYDIKQIIFLRYIYRIDVQMPNKNKKLQLKPL